jgi:hypothetical protein
MGQHHNDSMSEQGAPQVVAVESANQDLEIGSGVTNVELISSTSSTLAVTKLGAHMRPGRKLRLNVRADQSFTARITDSDEIEVMGGFRDLGSKDSIELQCRAVDGSDNPTLKWYEVGFTNIT